MLNWFTELHCVFFSVQGKLFYSPAKEFRPVRQTSRRNTAGSLLNSPLEETPPAVCTFFVIIKYPYKSEQQEHDLHRRKTTVPVCSPKLSPIERGR